MKKILSIVVFFACLTMYGSSVAAFKNVKIGEAAPAFNLKEINRDSTVSLESYYEKNKVIIVVFWATWSPRSLKELNDLKKIAEEFGDKGVEIIAVNVEKEDLTDQDIAAIKEVIENLQPNFKMLIDTGLNIFREYGVAAVPSTVVLDNKGTIRIIQDGYPTSAKLDMKEDVEVALGLREPDKDTKVAEVTGPKILKAAKLHFGMGKKLVERGMGIKAVRELEKAAKLDENYEVPLILLGEVYEDEYRRVRSKKKKATYLENAANAFSRALERDGENLFAYCGMARVYARQNKLDEANEALKNAMRIDSNFITCIVANGILLQVKGNHEEAVAEFLKALELNQNQPDVQLLISDSYANLQEYDNSIKHLKASFSELIRSVQINLLQD